jgi:hypothetical protein
MVLTWGIDGHSNLAEEIDQIATLLVDAYKNDPVATVVVGGNRALDYPLHRARAVDVVLGGSVYVASIAGNDIAGVLCAFGPGQATSKTCVDCFTDSRVKVSSTKHVYLPIQASSARSICRAYSNVPEGSSKLVA